MTSFPGSREIDAPDLLQVPMKLDDYNHFCSRLPFTTYVVQWGGAHVWKVGGKVFALGSAAGEDGANAAISFKCSPSAYEFLSEERGLRPAPYLASRGFKWVQHYSGESMDDATLKDYLTESHRLVVAGLPKKLRIEMNMEQK